MCRETTTETPSPIIENNPINRAVGSKEPNRERENRVR